MNSKIEEHLINTMIFIAGSKLLLTVKTSRKLRDTRHGSLELLRRATGKDSFELESESDQ